MICRRPLSVTMAAMLRGTWFLPALGVAALLWPSPAAADETGPTPAQKQAIYAKPSVVRVVAVWEGAFELGGRVFKEYAGGHGSGFFVSDDGFIATNAHVVREIHEGADKARDKLGRQAVMKMFRAFERELRASADPEGIVRAAIAGGRIVKRAEVVLPDGTKLPYEIKAYGAPVGEGQDVAIIKVETKHAPNLAIGDSDKVSVQDAVIAIGYPGAADLEGLFDDKSQLEASITDGAVSAIKRTTDGEPVLQVTTPITHGNSGGPAINLRGEVIGLATFGNRDKVQGFNFLVASSTVKKFVKEAKASNTPSETQVAWRKALEAQWSGDYDQAIVDYEEVMTLFPPHSEAPRMVKQARALKKEGKGKKKETAKKDDGGGGGAIAGVIIAVLLVGVIGTVVVVKKKKPSHGHGHLHPHGAFPPGPHGAPGPHGPHGPPGPHGSQPMMVGGRAGPAAQPVAKTVAIGQGGGHAPVAATAFGSFTIGSLTCTRGLLHGQRFSLTATGLLIGRQPGQAQIVVNDSRASGKHVWIGYENGALVAVDQGTTNGTFVNDVRLGRISKAPLKDGDTIIVAEPDCLSLTLKLS
jgi:serine protease Do